MVFGGAVALSAVVASALTCRYPTWASPGAKRLVPVNASLYFVQRCGVGSSGEVNASAFDIPDKRLFARLGLAVRCQLHGGFQSRVFEVGEVADRLRGCGPSLALKLIPVDESNRAHALERVRVRDQASRRDDRVVPIVPIGSNKVNRIDDCLAIASPMIQGRALDVTSRADVERMGRALSRLHESLRICRAELPPVAPLQVIEGLDALNTNHQLLHGDFGVPNLRLDTDGRLWVFDFDDCGYGPVEFELGNTLFMTLFDTSRSLNQPSDKYRDFRRWFLGAYRASAEHPVSELLVDLALQARSDALRYWLSHLDEAPPGIRNAPKDWHRHLRSFAGVISN